jgi:hypothetical protein
MQHRLDNAGLGQRRIAHRGTLLISDLDAGARHEGVDRPRHVDLDQRGEQQSGSGDDRQNDPLHQRHKLSERHANTPGKAIGAGCTGSVPALLAMMRFRVPTAAPIAVANALNCAVVKLCGTPAMAAGVTTKLWELADVVKVLEDWEAVQAVKSGDQSGE